jgi:hypothetical protein
VTGLHKGRIRPNKHHRTGNDRIAFAGNVCYRNPMLEAQLARTYRRRSAAAGPGAQAGRMLPADKRGLGGAYTRRILPGFIMLSGSIAVLIARITLTASPCSAIRKSILPQPMPCSPVQVPSSDSARWTSR